MSAVRGLALLLVSFAGCGSDPHIQRVSVPAVVGVDVAAAECALAQAGLHWRYRTGIRQQVAQSETAACGGRYPIGENVCSQHPRAGTSVAPSQIVALATWSSASQHQRRRCHAQRDHPDDPRATILDVAFTYFRTPKVGAGRAACRLLTGQERARLDRQPLGCAATLNKLLGGALIKGRETIAVILTLDSKAAVATASVLRMSIRGKPPVISLRNEHGIWRVFDTGL
jgi:hypothetical protein